MKYDASLEDWAEKIMYLIENRRVMDEYATNSRLIAEKMFSINGFKSKIENMIVMLKSTSKRYMGVGS